MTTYYNEIDPFAAEWLRALIARGVLPAGDVDTRSIEDVAPDDLRPYRQCHFFAGIGVWAWAGRCAGIPDEAEWWSGSCPCQPFSEAGKGAGFADERHLWPAWHWLIGERRPQLVFGEQVASRAGLAWLDLVSADLEASGYAVGVVNLPACGVGAPHRRLRTWFMAHALHAGRTEWRPGAGDGPVAGSGGLGDMAYSQSERRDGRRPGEALYKSGTRQRFEGCGAAGSLADDEGPGRQQRSDVSAAAEPTGRLQLEGGGRMVVTPGEQVGLSRRAWEPGRSGAVGDAPSGDEQRLRESGSDRGREQSFGGSSSWSNPDWIACKDGRWRPVEPGTFPLAHGAPARVGRLRGYGNAIVAPLAQVFIEEALKCL